jgi:AP-3 complex subunit mu
MSVTLDALYIFDDHKYDSNSPLAAVPLTRASNCVVEHVYSGRPPSSPTLISSLLSKPHPRPAISHLSDLAPPTTAYTITHSSLSITATSCKDAQSLAILDFLYRLLDVFEEFLGSPLLSSKIEDNYEVVAQLLGEMCDGGTICNTEPNALREIVEVTSALGQLFNKVGLPGYDCHR